MYNAQQLVDGIQTGKITIDLGGHRNEKGVDGILQDIIKKIQRMSKYYTEKSNSQDEKDARRGKVMLAIMGDESFAEVGEFLPFSHEVSCKTCGELFLYVLLKAEGLLTVGTYVGEKVVKIVESHCVFKDGVHPFEVCINLPSGRLLFGNYFIELPDAPKEEEYSPDWSLSHLRGQRNIAQYLANQQCGFIETGKMMVHIYKHNLRDELIISRCDLSEVEEYGYSPIPENESYSLMGTIYCEIWRVMWSDICNLESSGFKKLDQDYVEVQVSAGRWKCTDFFNSDDHKLKQPIMARIVRVAD